MALDQERIYQIYSKAARIYQQELNKPENPGLKYLEKRGFNLDYLNKCGVGFAPQNQDRIFMLQILSKLFPVYELIETKLAKVYLDTFLVKDTVGSQRITFPITLNNRIIGFSARTICAEVIPKYKTIFPSKNAPVINSECLNEENKEVFIAEGWIDCHTLNMNGIPAIGPLGAGNITINQKPLFEKYRGSFIFIYDQEESNIGNISTQRVSKVLSAMGFTELYYVKLPLINKKVDVNTLFLEYPHRFKEIVLNLKRFKIFTKPEEITKKSIRIKSNQNILEIISRITEPKQTSFGKYICRCPFPDHNDSNPSFFIRSDDQFQYFHCFGCNRRGGPSTFLRLFYGEGYSAQEESKITNVT